MRRFILGALILMLILVLSVPTLAQQSVVCNGQICGGNGIRAYEYDVYRTQVTNFEIGWHCGLCLYDVLMPSGWQWQIINVEVYKDDPFTPHGIVSPWSDYCPQFLRWSGPAVNNPIFGFNSTCPPHDVGWSVNSPFGPGQENWAAPVGLGEGPVHSPVPEPASLLALGSGLVALAGTILRRRS